MEAPSKASEDAVISGMQRGACELGLHGRGNADIAMIRDGIMVRGGAMVNINTKRLDA